MKINPISQTQSTPLKMALFWHLTCSTALVWVDVDGKEFVIIFLIG